MIVWWGRLRWGHKHTVVAVLIIFVISVFLWLFWMIGKAGYNQAVPR
jgi:uncharacterized membrane protein (DUF106 family)